MDLGVVCWALGAAFWLWNLFLGGAEQLEGTWLEAYLIGPVRGSIDPAMLLRLVGAVYFAISALILAL